MRRELRALVLLVAASLSACAGGEADGAPSAPAPTTVATAVPGGVTALPVAARSPLDGPYPRFRDVASGLTTILGTPDLAPGPQRISLVVTTADGLVRLPALQYELFKFESGAGGPSGPAVAQGVARFHAFPADTRGLYAARVEFASPGTWGLKLAVPLPDGGTASTLFAFEVPARAHTPLVGERAPRSRNRTLADTELAALSTGSTPDPALYASTIAAALDAGRPLVVVFASPGFCTNALCGPQVELLSELRSAYSDRASFIHVELYENPSTVRERGLDAAVRTPVLAEWGLVTDQWTFVIDRRGAVAARFEGFAPREEIEPALLATLE